MAERSPLDDLLGLRQLISLLEELLMHNGQHWLPHCTEVNGLLRLDLEALSRDETLLGRVQAWTLKSLHQRLHTHLANLRSYMRFPYHLPGDHVHDRTARLLANAGVRVDVRQPQEFANPELYLLVRNSTVEVLLGTIGLVE